MSVPVPLEGFGGGMPLNFAVKTYATKEALEAATPRENTIGVVTDTPISGYTFDAETPVSPEAGLLWITIGISGGIKLSATKKNPIRLCMVKARQYLEDAFVRIPCKIYQNGKWTAIENVLINAADYSEEGAQALFYAPYPYYSHVKKDGEYIVLQNTSGVALPFFIDTPGYIQNATELIVEGYVNGTGSSVGAKFGISKTRDLDGSNKPNYLYARDIDVGNYEYVLPLQQITGEYQISFYLNGLSSVYLKVAKLA